MGTTTAHVVKGSIIDQQVDVIVNTTAKDLDLANGGVSAKLLAAAGPEIQQECTDSAPDGVDYGELVCTSPGKLNCKRLYHGACKEYGQDQSEELFRKFVTNCLEQAEKDGYKTIALPAIGTGNLHYPASVAAQLMKEEIELFGKKHNKSGLTINIVIYHTPPEIYKEFSQVFSNAVLDEESEGASTPASADSIPAAAPVPKPPSGKDLTLVKGDLITQTVDVIVNTTGKDLELSNGGVSKVLAKAAGQTVQDECTKKAPKGLDFGQILVTSPGKLKCKEIYHGACREKSAADSDKVFRQFMTNCLMAAHKSNYSSIAFPAIGTGELKHPPAAAAQMMQEEVRKFLTANPASKLTDVRAVVFPANKQVVTAFEDVLCASSKPVAIADEFCRNIHIINGSIIEQKVDVIVNVTTIDLDLSRGAVSTLILAAAGSSIQDECSKQAPVKPGQVVATGPGNMNNCKALFHGSCTEYASSDAKQVLETFIMKCLTIAHQKGFTSIAFTALGTGNLKFPPKAAARIMLSVIGQFYTTCPTSKLANIYIVVLPTQTNISKAYEDELGACLVEGGTDKVTTALGSHFSLPVTDFRKALSELNVYWEKMPDGKNYVRVPLDDNGAEYKEIADAFKADTSKDPKKIERIQNIKLYNQFALKKVEVESCLEKDWKTPACLRLWHGTRQDVIENINKRGFNRMYSGHNAVCYGNGVYFAKKASYSANDTYSQPDGAGNKYMYYARVVVGTYIVGTSGMKEPPMRTEEHAYDTLTDNVANPTLFVVFHDAQAYPDYLVTF